MGEVWICTSIYTFSLIPDIILFFYRMENEDQKYGVNARETDKRSTIYLSVLIAK